MCFDTVEMEALLIFSFAPLQTGPVCSPEGNPEAPGTYGFGAMPPGSSTHAAAAVMAENSSIMEGMDLCTLWSLTAASAL